MSQAMSPNGLAAQQMGSETVQSMGMPQESPYGAMQMQSFGRQPPIGFGQGQVGSAPYGAPVPVAASYPQAYPSQYQSRRYGIYGSPILQNPAAIGINQMMAPSMLSPPLMGPAVIGPPVLGPPIIGPPVMSAMPYSSPYGNPYATSYGSSYNSIDAFGAQPYGDYGMQSYDPYGSMIY